MTARKLANAPRREGAGTVVRDPTAPLRILVVTHYWWPHRGGIETVAREQSRRLVARGDLVTAVTSRLPGDPAVQWDHGVPVHRVHALNFLARWGIPYPIYGPRLPWLLRRLLRTHDVALIHGHTYLASVATVSIAKRVGCPVVLFQHSPFIHYRFPWSAVECAADGMLGAYTLRSAQRLVVGSRYTGRYVNELAPGHEVAVLPFGVDTTRFTPPPDDATRPMLRQRLGLPSHRPLILTVRRLVFRNGVDTLLEAAEILRDFADIVVVGGGPEEQLIRDIMAERSLTNVFLAGVVPDPDLPDYYRASDLFVLPTRTGEGFGLVLLEAMASGLPVVATRGGGQEEVVADGVTGCLVPAEDPAALARACRELLGNQQRCEAMKGAALAHARSQDWDHQVQQLRDVLASAAAPGRRVRSAGR